MTTLQKIVLVELLILVLLIGFTAYRLHKGIKDLNPHREDRE